MSATVTAEARSAAETDRKPRSAIKERRLTIPAIEVSVAVPESTMAVIVMVVTAVAAATPSTPTPATVMS
jgi:hypothetical protein